VTGYPDRGLHGQVVQEVGRRIVSGAEPPGSILDIEHLEATFDVSKTVVREALKVLAAKGLVDARPKRGTFVRPRADWSLLDPDLLRWQFESSARDQFLTNLHEVRLIVEPAGARLAAVRRTDDDLGALERAITLVPAEASPEEIVEADLTFHRTLLAASHNELLARMEHIIEIGLRARDLLVHAAGHREDFLPPHQAVLAAVRSGDPDAAEQAMRGLLDQAARDQAELGGTRP
jgi:GntR family transcriptional regulator, galactonate operon transcriptional repressor